MMVPTPEQSAILALGLDTFRISAGAGTGKTTTVAMVIANLVNEHGVEPEQVLGITFTNKAAAELADRVRTSIAESADPGREVEVHTYHGFAAQILSEFGLLAGLDRRPEVITPTFARQILSEVFYNRDLENLNMTWTGQIARVKQLGDRLGDHLLQPSDLLQSDHPDDEPWSARVEMLEVLDQYTETKRELSVVDYSDLVTLATAVARDHPSVATTIRERYRVVVLDEYQDTNPAQRVLLTSLFSDGFPVIAVGDVDQTIYEWRGASSENFEEFVDHFTRPDQSAPVTRELTGNYRSGQRILDVANEIRLQANPLAARLVSPTRTDGTIEAHWAGDALGEAEWIARRFEKLHDDGFRWADMAVLFRKNKDFPVVVESLARHDIPIEVANLGGLFSVPEVAELRAWMTILARPGDSPSVLQILLGSRYRLGLADLSPVVRWIDRITSTSQQGDELRMAVVEALDADPELDAIRPDAKERLTHFIDMYRRLLTETQGASLVETSRMILDQTRAWADVESLPPVARITARLNLYRFLDLAEDWSPLRGRSSLPAFLDYIEAMEESPAEELDAARLSGEDAVTLVTVHRAKGLEWEVVAIPALTKENFPSRSSLFPDPDTKASILPVEFRIDQKYRDMPADPKERRAFLREEHAIQEWRVAYVAATRAKSHLLVSGAHWYGHPEPNQNAKSPSPLFDLVRDHPHTIDTGFVDEPPRPDVLRHSDMVAAPDPVFPDGWAKALATEVAQPGHSEAVARSLGVESRHREEVESWTETLFELPDSPPGPVTDGDVTVSVTGMVTYAGCPRQFYWSEVDRLPRRRSEAAVAGTEVHRRIELFQKGNIPIEEISAQIYDVPDDGFRPGAYRTFESSRFARAPAARVEAPFTMSIRSGLSIRGRIDAIYADGGHWEVVDFKSGRPSVDPAKIVQLEAYAVACDLVDFELGERDSLQATFAYLGDGLIEETHRVDGEWMTSARSHLDELADGIIAESFEATPSDRCHGCDFLRFCEPGRRHLGEQ